MDLTMIGVGLMMGMAVIGGGIGQGVAARAAFEGVGRNPAATTKITGPLVTSMALIESSVLFTFVLAMLALDVV
jgi:F-type H+-transporting ATPase subunit c